MQPTPFEASASEVEGVRVIAVRGELDLGTAPDLEGPLNAAVEGNNGSVLVDLEGCEFIDSTGIALIVRAWQRLAEDGSEDARLAICCAGDQVRRVLEISGVDQTIPVHESREQALAELRGG